MKPIPYIGWQDLDAQQSILAAWEKEAAKASSTPSPTSPSGAAASCYGTTVLAIGIDPAVVNDLANVFCDTADLTRDSSKTVGGSDLKPAVAIANDRKGLFHFRKDVGPSACDGSEESCRDIYSSIISTCGSSPGSSAKHDMLT